MLNNSTNIVSEIVQQRSGHARFAQMRGVWLRGPGRVHGATRRLMNSSRFAGMQLDVLTYARLPLIPFWRYDLIVLEQAHDQAVPAVLASIKRARALSKAPLVVLMRRLAPEVSVAGLNAGADAVTSLLSSEEVLLAHWSAILKRWKVA